MNGVKTALFCAYDSFLPRTHTQLTPLSPHTPWHFSFLFLCNICWLFATPHDIPRLWPAGDGVTKTFNFFTVYSILKRRTEAP